MLMHEHLDLDTVGRFQFLTEHEQNGFGILARVVEETDAQVQRPSPLLGLAA